MPLKVNTQPDTIDVFTFVFVVPGLQAWRPRSVVATVQTAAGGTGGRGYTLELTDGTNVVAQVPANDGGNDPAVGTITWTSAPAALSTAGPLFTSLAPIPKLTIVAGYTIVGTIVNPTPGDTWVDALVWYDYQDTPGR